MIPYWKTARERWRIRFAVSRTPRASTSRTMLSISGESISAIGRGPIFGSTSTSSEFSTFSA